MSLTQAHARIVRFLIILLVLSIIFQIYATRIHAIDTPSSEDHIVDNPLFRIPLMKNAPTIDGGFDLKEWEDSSALTGFWINLTIGLRVQITHSDLAPFIAGWIV